MQTDWSSNNTLFYQIKISPEEKYFFRGYFCFITQSPLHPEKYIHHTEISKPNVTAIRILLLTFYYLYCKIQKVSYLTFWYFSTPTFLNINTIKQNRIENRNEKTKP